MWTTEQRTKISEVCITLLAAALAVGGFFAARSYRNYEAQKAAILKGPPPGSAVNVAGINWASNRFSLLFVMQVGCHWCEASAGFYKDFLRSDSTGAIHPIAVLPQPVSDARVFLKSMGLNFQDVRQADLKKVGTNGTPTLILVNSAGKVVESWVGKLPPTWEGVVFEETGIRRLSAD